MNKIQTQKIHWSKKILLQNPLDINLVSFSNIKKQNFELFMHKLKSSTLFVNGIIWIKLNKIRVHVTERAPMQFNSWVYIQFCTKFIILNKLFFCNFYVSENSGHNKKNNNSGGKRSYNLPNPTLLFGKKQAQNIGGNSLMKTVLASRSDGLG